MPVTWAAAPDTRHTTHGGRQLWRIAAALLLTGTAGWSDPPAPTAPPAAAGSVTVVLSNFAFTPDRILLHAGVPVRFHLVNHSGRGHDFSAPDLFAHSSVASGAALVDGKIEVAAHQSTDVTLTPRVPGRYDVTCTHFLHSLFGMTATVQVVP